MSSNPQNGQFLMDNCNFTLKNCNFNGVEGQQCASQYCNGFPTTEGTCPSVGLDPNNCCGSSNTATCLYNYAHNGLGGGGGGGGGAASANVCASVVSIISVCSAASPTLFPSSSILISGPGATALASCMCYSDGTYNPQGLDDFAAECVSSGSAAHPTYFPYASHLLGFCTNNVAAPASATATPTPAASSNAPASRGPASSTAVVPGTSASQQVPATGSTTSSTSIVTSAVVSSAVSSAAVESSSAASATSKSSSGAVKNTFQAGGIFLLGLSMLVRLY